MKASTLVLRTAEGVVFELPLAGPVARCLAWLVDALALGILAAAVASIMTALAAVMPDLAQALGVLVFFLAQTGYGIATEWLWRGQTAGKRLLGLRVVDADGLRLEFAQVALRNLLRVIDALPLFYLVGGVSCVWTRHVQRLGDLAANTVVVRTPRSRRPDYDQITAGRFNSLRAHSHLAARLRQRVGPAEATAALQALLRRDTLDPTARVALYADFASHFRRLVTFPAEAVEGLTDEAYLRAVVDILFRAR